MALGKKLNNLLGDYFGDEMVTLTPSKPEETENKLNMVRNIPISAIEISSFQTRKKFDIEKIQSLAHSIEQSGLLHPIVVLQKNAPNSESYILLAGERRLRATKLLGGKTILAVVKTEDQLSTADQAMITAVENLHREDLNPVELAKTFEMLIETQNIDEFGLSSMIGKSTQYIKNYLRLLTLPIVVQKMIIDDELSEGQARQLVPLELNKQLHFANIIQEKRLTVKEIVELLKREVEDKNANNDEQLDKADEIERNAVVFNAHRAKHNLPVEVIKKADKLAQIFPNSTLKCVGDESYGKIIITWKKDANIT